MPRRRAPVGLVAVHRPIAASRKQAAERLGGRRPGRRKRVGGRCSIVSGRCFRGGGGPPLSSSTFTSWCTTCCCCWRTVVFFAAPRSRATTHQAGEPPDANPSRKEAKGRFRRLLDFLAAIRRQKHRLEILGHTRCVVCGTSARHHHAVHAVYTSSLPGVDNEGTTVGFEMVVVCCCFLAAN
jgi:hypothetical protein